MNDVINNLKVQIFADGANLGDISKKSQCSYIKGFTTNPLLMNQSGIVDYWGFAKQSVALVGKKSISFEVFSDDFEAMKREAHQIHALGDNVYVKIPVTNSRGESTMSLVKELSENGLKINVTAVFTLKQIEASAHVLQGSKASYISIFSGRIADAGVNPLSIVTEALKMTQRQPNIQIIWASPRELYNIIQADECGCDIITVSEDILKKISYLGKDLNEFSLETVKMFKDNADAAGYAL